LVYHAKTTTIREVLIRIMDGLKKIVLGFFLVLPFIFSGVLAKVVTSEVGTNFTMSNGLVVLQFINDGDVNTEIIKTYNATLGGLEITEWFIETTDQADGAGNHTYTPDITASFTKETDDEAILSLGLSNFGLNITLKSGQKPIFNLTARTDLDNFVFGIYGEGSEDWDYYYSPGVILKSGSASKTTAISDNNAGYVVQYGGNIPVALGFTNKICLYNWYVNAYRSKVSWDDAVDGCTNALDSGESTYFSYNVLPDLDDSTGQGEVFNITNFRYANKNFNYSAQETSPGGMFFKSDGLKLYIIGYLADDHVYQYSLSSAWDISTASYDTKSCDVSGEGSTSTGVAFNSDGTKMYKSEYSTNKIYQYSLSSAWDVSTCSYDGVSEDVIAQGGQAQDVVFNDDGTKMYVAEEVNHAVDQYTLGTGWDLETVTYASKTCVTGAVNGFDFNDDGTKLFIIGSPTIAYQYSLSSAWDVSTCSYDGVSFNTIPETVYKARDIKFNGDGNRFYIISDNTDYIWQYGLSPPDCLDNSNTCTWGGYETTNSFAELFSNLSLRVYDISESYDCSEVTLTYSDEVNITSDWGNSPYVLLTLSCELYEPQPRTQH